MGLADLFFTFSGRINRGKLWLGVLLLTVIGILGYLGIVALLGVPFTVSNLDDVAANNAEPLIEFSVPGLIGYAVLTLISGFMYFSLMIKRCHDRGKSGWWSLLSLIPIVGFIWFIIDLGVMEGDEGPNQYGPNPLRV